ncbi:MAG: serine hydrolase [Rhodothermales bacterium]|nr:serine hydrolase [Rhodothermales bacterium]
MRILCHSIVPLPVLTLVCAIGLSFGISSETRGQASQTDSLLQIKLENRISDFAGDVGIYVEHLPSGMSAGVNADSLFPTASMIKVPILLTIFDRIVNDTLSLSTPLTYRDSLYYEGADVLGSFKDGEEITLDKLLLLMMSLSDNTASLWLQEISGSGTSINEWLATSGFEGTRVNSRTPGRSSDWEKYGWGQTTPREMATLLRMIRKGEAISEWASEEMYRTLTRQYWNDEALSAIPPYVQAAGKVGAVSRSKSEVVLVNGPSGDYVFCVITNNQEDDRWEDDNAGYVLIRSISETLWQHFEPGSQWRPAKRSEP